jgi:hypothetical protein
MDCDGNNTSVLCRDDLKGQVLLDKFADEEEEESLSDSDYDYNHDFHDADYQGGRYTLKWSDDLVDLNHEIVTSSI